MLSTGCFCSVADHGKTAVVHPAARTQLSSEDKKRISCLQEDSDAMTVASFEHDLEDMFQEVPELQNALITYLEARGRRVRKNRNRGFWPTSQGSKAKGGKHKDFKAVGPAKARRVVIGRLC